MRGNKRVLCVDDEPNVLEGLSRSLRRYFEVVTAVGPEAGLLALEKNGPFAAIVSDLRMPGMDGIAFFEASRKIAPQSMRVLLTGQADLDSALAAINRGAIFRFLLKPCAPDVLQEALTEATKQYDLLASSRSSAPARSAAGSNPPTAASSLGDALQRFLVVDASATVRRIISNTLEAMGYPEVVEAKDGEEAVELFGPSIRCVITEWDLPSTSGLELVRSLRLRPHGDRVPIIMVSKRGHRADILAAKDSGVDSYIVKPISKPVLKEKIEAALRATR